MPNWWQRLDTLPKTLVHNDFNPRNIAFRKTSSGLRLCVYDWELATLNVPQHDLAELLVFVLDDQVTRETVLTYVEHHRRALERASDQSFAQDNWWQGFCDALKDLMINRIAMYMMAHTARHYDFMERVYRTLRHLISIVQEEPDRTRHA